MVGVGGTSNYLPVVTDPQQAVSLDHQPVESAFRWATVTSVDPLRIKFDGESGELPMTPESLVSPLAVDNRVWVQLLGRRVIVIGVGNSTSGVPPGSVIMFAGSGTVDGYLRCDGQAVSRSAYSLLFSAIGTGYGGGDGSTTFNVPNFNTRFPAGYTPGTTGGATTVTLTETQLPSHSHGGGSHTHGNTGHSHSTPGHSHSTAGHNHTTNAHAHGQNVGVLGGTPFSANARGDYNGDGDLRIYQQLISTDSAAVAVNYADVGINAAAVTVNAAGVDIHAATVSTGAAGGGGSHENRPPYLGVGFLVKY